MPPFSASYISTEIKHHDDPCMKVNTAHKPNNMQLLINYKGLHELRVQGANL